MTDWAIAILCALAVFALVRWHRRCRSYYTDYEVHDHWIQCGKWARHEGDCKNGPYTWKAGS